MTNSRLKREIETIRRRLGTLRSELDFFRLKINHAIQEAAAIRDMSRTPARPRS